MKKIIFVLCFIPILLFGQDDYEKLPGYVDLSELEGLKDADETVEVFITKPLLSMVASMSSSEDSSLSNLLGNLALIRVEKFSLSEKKMEKVKNFIDRVSKKLNKEKWSRIVRVKEANERVEIFLKNQGKHVAGLLIMALEENKEAVFINIVGRINMEQLGKLSKKFNIPELDSVGVEKKKGKN